MDKPTISVCMITYNHEAFIAKAIEGVLMQCDVIFELLISEDASPDNSSSIIKRTIKDHPNGFCVKYIRNSKNKGVNRNFVDTLSACTGKYIAICEGDDYWTDPFKLKKQIDFLESNPSYVMSFHNGISVNEHGDQLNGSLLNTSTRRDLSYEDLLSGYYTIPTLSVMFKNGIVDYFPVEFYHVANCDTFLFLLLAQHGLIHFHADIQGAVHIVNDHGIWSKKNNLYKALNSYNTYFRFKKLTKDKRLRLNLLNFGNSIIIYSLRERRWRLFFKYYLKNIFLSLHSTMLLGVFFSKHKSFFFSDSND